MSQSVLGVTPDLATLGTQRQGQNMALPRRWMRIITWTWTETIRKIIRYEKKKRYIEHLKLADTLQTPNLNLQ